MNASSTAGRAQLSRLAPAARRGVAAVAAGRDRAAAAAAAGRDSAAAAAGRVGSWMNAYATSAALELPKQKARAKRLFDRMSEWAMRPAACRSSPPRALTKRTRQHTCIPKDDAR